MLDMQKQKVRFSLSTVSQPVGTEKLESVTQKRQVSSDDSESGSWETTREKSQIQPNLAWGEGAFSGRGSFIASNEL